MRFLLVTAVAAALQLALFSLPPLAWWAATARRRGVPARAWIGLVRPVVAAPRATAALVAGTVAAGTAVAALLYATAVGSGTVATAGFAGRGAAALPAALVYGFVQTGLAEEVLFRGFLARRLVARRGFAAGNALQAAGFGGLHGLMMLGRVPAPVLLPVVALTGGLGWAMCYLNERRAGGSIVPGWIVHGATNTLVAMATALATG